MSLYAQGTLRRRIAEQERSADFLQECIILRDDVFFHYRIIIQNLILN